MGQSVRCAPPITQRKGKQTVCPRKRRKRRQAGQRSHHFHFFQRRRTAFRPSQRQRFDGFGIVATGQMNADQFTAGRGTGSRQSAPESDALLPAAANSVPPKPTPAVRWLRDRRHGPDERRPIYRGKQIPREATREADSLPPKATKATTRKRRCDDSETARARVQRIASDVSGRWLLVALRLENSGGSAHG